ncbi:xanthine dehydrogenase family protein subunit M [Actinocrispum sp. NPDC049592]|uniref:FAD binding domain-containing protein n=1 Tax=Actinocrispum sp. NPDC049592 TaxID=3154835 RepID=UPI0034376F6B
MRAFSLTAVPSVEDAVQRSRPGSAYLAGATTLVDLMKLEVLHPNDVVDINALPLRGITVSADGVRIGALERMSDVAAHPHIAAQYPVIAQALLRSASQQIRTMASIGGNLLQRTRCGYYRDVTTPCNKREPGSGCPALAGGNRMHAVLGTSKSCVATHASDLAVALIALDVSLRLYSDAGTRTVRLADFYLLPGETPDLEHDLRPGELITEVLVPPLDWASRSVYLKIRDRESYEFALCSAAVALDVRDGVIADARIALGGVGTVPWRMRAVEAALRGARAGEAAFVAAAEQAADGMKLLSDNGFKATLATRTIVRALLSLEV